MKLYGKPDSKPSRDKMRRQTVKDLETLYSISIASKEPPRKRKNQTAVEETGNYAKSRIIAAHKYENGYFKVDFSPQMAQYLTRAYITLFSTRLFLVDDCNPSAYTLGKKLQNHAGIDNNIRKGTAGIISVESLLKICPAIPTYEKVMAGDRNISKSIISPFEKALDELKIVSVLAEWEYCNAKKVPLTEDQLSNMDYNVFKELYVKFAIADAPDQTARIEANEKKAKEAAKRKEQTIQRNINKSQNRK